MASDLSEFDRAIALSPRDATSYDAVLDAGWQIGGGINGGLLLALMGNSIRATLDGGHAEPLSATAYYVSASRPGPATLRTEVMRSGRSTSTSACTLLQEDGDAQVERVRALATYGDLSALPDDVRTVATPPEMPPPEHCVSTADAPPTFLSQAGLLERLDLRLDPACVGWAVGEPSGRGEVRGWLRMADGREPDPLLLLFDAHPRAHRPRACRAGTRLAPRRGLEPQRRRRHARGGRRGLGLQRPAGRAVAPAGARATPAVDQARIVLVKASATS
jgi:hypothetical protein